MTRRFVACAGMALALTIVAWAAPAADAAGKDAVIDWSAGPVRLGTGYAQPGGSDRVREVQRRLRKLGYRPGPVDGLFGPRTSRAARRFQRSSGLVADAIVGSRTLAALRTRGQVEPTERAAAPVAHPAPIGPLPPPEPRPRVRAPSAAPVQSGPSVSVLALIALTAAASLAVGLRFGARRGNPRARTDEIVARSAAELPPRWSRTARQRTKVQDRTNAGTPLAPAPGRRDH